MGILYLVPTPIGNLDDISFRCVKILKEVDAVVCEDTRVSGKLLHILEIKKPLISNHTNNEHRVSERIVERILAGENLAMVTDAGSPGISDPGYLLVKEAIKKGVEVIPIPGATAIIPALTCSGLPCDKFFFEGFLPHKKGRQTRIQWLLELPNTFALYESPHRLLKTLQQFSEHAPDRQVSVSREITKKFEQHVRGTVTEALEHYTTHDVKGEFVLVFGGKD